jgi:hypothetical protein
MRGGTSTRTLVNRGGSWSAFSETTRSIYDLICGRRPNGSLTLDAILLTAGADAMSDVDGGNRRAAGAEQMRTRVRRSRVFDGRALSSGRTAGECTGRL